jgi:phenylacetate-CoA ligase
MTPWIARNLVYHPIQLVRGEPVARALRELEETQWYSREHLARWQWERVQRAVTRAIREVPYYSAVAASAGVTPESIQAPADLRRLPLTTKATVKTRLGELVNRGYRGRVSRKTTGGSTGQTVTVIKDRIATAYARALMWRGYGWWGLQIGDRQGRLWGVPLTFKGRLRYRLIDMVSNRIRLSAFNFREKELYRYYGRLLRFQPDYLYGYASMICELATFLKRHDLPLAISKVVTTSEVLYPQQRRLIQEVLQCSVINEYGCGELGPIAYECPAGRLHLMADNLYCECLRDDGTDAGPGEVGELVITELHSQAMPLVRYRIMDYVELGDGRCECGRGLPTIQQVIGRSYEYLLSSSGRRFHGEKVLYLLEDLHRRRMGIDQMQVTQTALNRLTIKLVVEPGYKSQATERIRAYFVEALGGALEIEFQMVDQIPREPSGKLRLVACHAGL